MTFRLLRDEPLAESLRRVLVEQADKARAALAQRRERPHEAVHETRKRFKKVRALLRLTRGPLDDYSELNGWFRDEAKALSDVRDAQQLVEALDGLVELTPDTFDPDDAAPFRRALCDHRDHVATRDQVQKRLRELRATLPQMRERLGDLPLAGDDFELVEKGLGKTYGRGRRAMKKALDAPSSSAFHEWRKRAKYLRFQMKLLRPLVRTVDARRKQLRDLSSGLGDAHDLAMLHAWLVDHEETDGHRILLGLVATRRAELRLRAAKVGPPLYVEEPKAFVERLSACHAHFSRDRDAVEARLSRVPVAAA